MVERVNSGMIYLIYCKNFCKCHNVYPPPTQHSNNFSKNPLCEKKKSIVTWGFYFIFEFADINNTRGKNGGEMPCFSSPMT
jgi:hypothetical protein